MAGTELELIEHDVPPVAPDGVLVRVKAAGVNPVDTKIRAGYMKDALPFHFPVILGWDVSGVVEQVGPAVTWFKPGDQVYGYIRRHHLQYGTYAEYATAPEGFFAHMPPELSFEEAAALPLSVLTAHQGLESLGLRGGETCTSAAARAASATSRSSSRSHAARAWSPPRPSATTTSCASSGPRRSTTRTTTSPRACARCFDDSGSDAAFDLFGGDAREQAFSVLRPGGRLVSIARPPPEPREGHHEVHYIYVRPSGYDLGEHITPLIAEGSLRPTVEATYPLEQAAEAHERIEAGHVRGKLVLTLAD